MSDNEAVLEGYTDEWMAMSRVSTSEFPILVKPGTDMMYLFRAWNMDEQKLVNLNGWGYTYVQYLVNGESYADRDLAIAYANKIYEERGVIVAVDERRVPE